LLLYSLTNAFKSLCLCFCIYIMSLLSLPAGGTKFVIHGMLMIILLLYSIVHS